ncbi:MAG TPA: hypothetical protein VF765_30645 [Polyangiaceae bacterium]
MPSILPGPMGTFEDEVVLLRRCRLALAGASIPLVLGAVFTCLPGAGSASAFALGIALAWLGLGALLYVVARNPAPHEVMGRVYACGAGLLLPGRFVPAERIRGGWVEPRVAGAPVVHVCTEGGGEVALVVRDVERGRQLLVALGVDASHVAATFWALARPLGEPRTFARVGLLAGIAMALGILAGQESPAAAALAVIALLVAMLGFVVPTRVSVGADGVHLRWLGTSRFVSWSDVFAVEPFDGGVVLALEGGQWLTLRTPAEHERHDPDRVAMIERLRTAWRASQQAHADPVPASIVRSAGERGVRTRDWVRAMRTLAHPQSGYRSSAVPPEGLWRIVESPHADRDARTGAAIALASSLDASGRQRLREAAAACAEPRLRVSLTTASMPTGAASDEELAAALDAIDGEVEDGRRC